MFLFFGKLPDTGKELSKYKHCFSEEYERIVKLQQLSN